MTAIKGLLRDRRRAQRGSVLSAVLIMVAFLAIISGALTTELSTHFLISRALVNRVGNEATVNSAMELALDQLQNSALANGCPGATSTAPLPAPVTLNGRTAAISYVSCWPAVDARSPRFTSIAPSASYNIDGSHSIVNGQDLYLIGSGSTIYQYSFGESSPNWPGLDLQSNITGPALAMADGTIPLDSQDISNLVPIDGGGDSGCTATACVVFLAQDFGSDPDGFPPSCYMPANGPVTSQPAAGVAIPTVAYFGDGSGTLWAYTATEKGNCALRSSIATPGNAPIVAGPVVFQNGTQDEIFVVTSQGSTSQLVTFTYKQGSPLSWADTLGLPYSSPVGIAVEKTTAPGRVAVTFTGGGVAMVNIPANYDPALLTNMSLGPGVARAPSWCTCPAGPQIGVAGLNGTLYVLDTSLSVVASYAGGSPIQTTPASDGVGEWFFGADDGWLHEVQQPAGQSTMLQVAQYGPFLGQVRSSVQVGSCPTGICIYLGARNSNAFMVALDARRARLIACLSTAPPACSTDNPRLLAQVEVGIAGSQQTVHVQGWSYYSP